MKGVKQIFQSLKQHPSLWLFWFDQQISVTFFDQWIFSQFHKKYDFLIYIIVAQQCRLLQSTCNIYFVT